MVASESGATPAIRSCSVRSASTESRPCATRFWSESRIRSWPFCNAARFSSVTITGRPAGVVAVVTSNELECRGAGDVTDLIRYEPWVTASENWRLLWTQRTPVQGARRFYRVSDVTPRQIELVTLAGDEVVIQFQ